MARACLLALSVFPGDDLLPNGIVGRRLLALSAVLLGMVSRECAYGQAPAASQTEEAGGVTASARNNDIGPSGIIPATKGLNFSLGTTSQHDSSNGWSSVLNPNLAFRFNRHFSADVGVPLYMYINVDANVGTAAKPVYGYVAKKHVFGDTTVSGHFDLSSFIDYNLTGSMGLPSGNTDYGLGAGQVTYSFDNHFEKSLGIFTPDIEIGFGDSNILVNERVLKPYVAVGPQAHFQAGTAVDLFWNMSFEADAYEEMPLSKDLVYSTTGKGKKKVTTSTNEGPAEDNGFTTALDIPFTRHVTLSGFYNRSLINHDDVVGFSFTFLLRPPPRALDVVP